MNLTKLQLVGLVGILIMVISLLFVGPLSGLNLWGNSGADGGGGAPSSMAQIEIDVPNASAPAETTITIRTRVIVKNRDDVRIDGAVVCLYNGSGGVLHSHPLSTITGDEDGNYYNQTTFTVRISEPPKYIFVDHPDLRGDDAPAYSEVVEKENHRLVYTFHQGGVHSFGEFGFPRTNQTGKCG